MASEKIRFEINTGTDTSAAGQAADQLQAFAAKLTGASPPGACPPHGTERCDHCGDLPVLRIWSDRDRALWDEHPGDLMSRVDSLDGQDQEVPAAQVRQDHGPLVIVWHQPGACPPGCDLPRTKAGS